MAALTAKSEIVAANAMRFIACSIGAKPRLQEGMIK
jgi:hypothetical protein